MNLGIGWDEEGWNLFKGIIYDHATYLKHEGITPVYVETGIGEGTTLANVCTLLQSTGSDFVAYGVDIENGWSLNQEKVAEAIKPFNSNVHISLLGSRTFLLDYPAGKYIDLLLIDSCHEQDCVMIDFLLAKPKMAKDAIIFFHDSDPAAQGKDIQPHHGNPIGVRAALEYFGFIENKHPGWTKIIDYIPKSEDARGFFAIKKVKA